MVIVDHAIVCAGLRVMLESGDDVVVVGEASDSRTALDLVARLHPDVVLFDIGVHQGDAAELVHHIRRRSPKTAVVILTAVEQPGLLERLLAAGARGYVLKSATRQELVSAIHGVRQHDSRIVLSVSVASLNPAPNPVVKVLSDREMMVLRLTAEALTNAQIASRLSLTVPTVKRHLRNIYAKLGAVSRVDAVNKAVAASLITTRPEQVQA